MSQPSYADPVPSLLWPAGHDRRPGSAGISAQQALDLGLDLLVGELDWDGRHAAQTRSLLLALVADPLVIAYRQELVAELAGNDRLREALAALLPNLAELAQPRSAGWAQESPLLTLPPRLSDLEHYVACVEALHAALSSEPPRSAALRGLRDYVTARRDSPEFQSLVAELPGLREQLNQAASITIGVNLDRDLRPVAVTLVAVNAEPFAGPRSLAQRLLGRSTAATVSGMTILRQIADRSPEVDPLARDLQQILSEVVQPLAAALERYGRIQSRPLAALEPELAFVLGAIRFARRRADQGLPICLPSVSQREHLLDGAYNPGLAIQLAAAGNNGHAGAALVPNPIDFELGRIVFLTGPNRGGKTTYLRAIGQNQVLFQAGVFVAAQEARMLPADAILTHFPPVESVEPGGGRLDDEARRMREIFAQATAASLLLFNEPLTSTGEREAQTIAADLLRALRLLGARTVYVTHLHALAEELPALNRDGDGATIVSWSTGVGDDKQRTYVIRPGSPAARSHAAAIAEQHGITFAQLARQLAERGLAPG
jgi:DNA mismatch repair protein MutS